MDSALHPGSAPTGPSGGPSAHPCSVPPPQSMSSAPQPPQLRLFPKRPDANLLWRLRTGPLGPTRPRFQSLGPGPCPPAPRAPSPSGQPRRRPHPAAHAARELVQTQLPQVLLDRGAHCPARRLHGRAAATPCKLLGNRRDARVLEAGGRAATWARRDPKTRAQSQRTWVFSSGLV